MKNLINFSLLVLLMGLTFSCSDSEDENYNPNNDYEPNANDEVNIKDFKKIDVDINGEVYVEYGSEQVVYIDAPDDVQDALSRKVDKDTWDIKLSHEYDDYDVYIHIITPNLEKVDIHRDAKVYLNDIHSKDGKFHADVYDDGEIYGQNLHSLYDEIHLDLKGNSTHADFTEIDTKDVKLHTDASSTTNLSGITEEFEMETKKGSSVISAGDLISKKAEIKIEDSSSEVTITCNKDLEIKVKNSSAKIHYKGDPEKIEKDIDGSSVEIENIN